LESKILSEKKGIWKFECRALVNKKVIGEASILCADRLK